MMLKAAFVEKIDDNNSDFKFVACGCKRGANKVFSGDNQI